jgi:hypothetical protein
VCVYPVTRNQKETMIVQREPKFCKRCDKIRTCQRPGGEWIFTAILLVATVGVYFFMTWELRSPLLGLLSSVATLAITVTYLIIALRRPWICGTCGSEKIFEPAAGDSTEDDDEEDRPRKKKRRQRDD